MKTWKKVSLAATTFALATTLGIMGTQTEAQAVTTSAATAAAPTAWGDWWVEPEPTYYYDDVRNFAFANSPVRISVGFADDPAGNGSYYNAVGWASGPSSGGMTLSNTIAKDWRTANGSTGRNIIIHEIGHAVSGYCYGLYSGPAFNSNDEDWATAYAWSRGYTGDGSGASLYGAPTQTQVAEASKCR